ncbi:hypothetical protein [Sinorhizobium medicae]|uniref:hypothetical protein n=1 Tax=Sinorhizobium medicae TaxID=110321 RepID=UPI0013E2FCB6|nr:hypothetical protein [Sinorhizobium medicae]
MNALKGYEPLTPPPAWLRETSASSRSQTDRLASGRQRPAEAVLDAELGWPGGANGGHR